MNTDVAQVKIKEIRLESDFFVDPFYVCDIQLESPFWNEIEERELDGDKYLYWRDYYVEKRFVKIKKLLSNIEDRYIKKKKRIRVLVFPEYSVQERMHEYLKEYVGRNDVMIVAGDYDQVERSAYCNIFYKNNGEVCHCKQYKISPSRYDEEYIAELDVEKKIINRFVWVNAGGNENVLMVYICHDYLEYYCETANKQRAGLYLVVMCSPKIEEFYGLSSVIMRSVIGNKSNVVMLCNASSGSELSYEKEFSPCGQSQIIGPIKNRCVIEDKVEGGILAKISLNTVSTKITRIPNTEVISNVTLFHIDKNGDMIKDYNTEQDYYIIIDPNSLLKGLEMRKIYAMYCIKNYAKFLEVLKNIPLQSNAIFGVYDVLIKSYEEGVAFFEKRLSGYLGDKYHDLSDPDLPPRKIYRVTDVLKYRNEILCEIDESGAIKYKHEYSHLREKYFIENIVHVKNIVSGLERDSEFLDELMKRGVLMMVRSDSDVFPEDNKKGSEEYLVFVDIYPNGDKTRNLVNKDFRRIVIGKLMNEYKVRTIEFCGESHESEYINDGGYILHMVGSLKDVREIIFGQIHDNSAREGIRCRTHVVPAAGYLSKDMHLHLDEKMIRDPEIKRFVLDIIPYMKYVDPKNPFIIKQVDKSVIEVLSEIYYEYRKLFESGVGLGEMMNKINRFVYGVCYLYKYSDADYHHIISTYCMDAYMIVVSEINDHFVFWKNVIRKEVDNMNEMDRVKYLKLKANKDKYVDDIISSQQNVLGEIRDAIKIWVENYENNGVQISKDLTDINNVIKYRNKFAHQYPCAEDTKKEVLGLMHAMRDALLFINKYYSKGKL